MALVIFRIEQNNIKQNLMGNNDLQKTFVFTKNLNDAYTDSEYHYMDEDKNDGDVCDDQSVAVGFYFLKL